MVEDTKLESRLELLLVPESESLLPDPEYPVDVLPVPLVLVLALELVLVEDVEERDEADERDALSDVGMTRLVEPPDAAVPLPSEEIRSRFYGQPMERHSSRTASGG